MPNTGDPIELVWEAPPKKEPKSKYTTALKQLKENRGRWGRIVADKTSSSAHSSASGIRKLTADDPHWLIVTRLMEGETEKYGVWVCYRTPEQLRADNGA